MRQPQLLQRRCRETGGVPLVAHDDHGLGLVDLRDAVRARWIETPLEHVALDHDRTRDVAVDLAERGRPDVDEQCTSAHRVGGLDRLDPLEPGPSQLEQFVDREAFHTKTSTCSQRGWSTLTVIRMTLTTSYWPADTSDEVRPTTIGGVLREAAAAAPDRVAMVAGMPNPADRHAMDLRRVAGRRRADRPRAPDAVRAGRARRGVGAEHPRVGAAAIRRRAGRARARHGQPGVPGRRSSSTCCASRARSALFTMPEYRGNPMAKSVESVRAGLPGSARRRAVQRVARLRRRRRSVRRGAARRRARRRRRRCSTRRAPPGFPKGALLHHRGITNDARLVTSRFGVLRRRRAGEPDAAVPRRRLRAGGARHAERRRHVHPGARVRPRARVGARRDRARPRSWAGCRRCSSR